MSKCRLCNDFQRNPRQFRFTFDCNQAELTRSANDGCVICSFLLEGFRHFESKLEGFKDHDRIYIWGGNVDGGGSAEMEIFSDGALKLRLEFFTTKGKSIPLKGARMLPTIPGDTRAPASMEWAKQRLQQCVGSHESCGQRIVPKLPSRVLEIKPDKEGRMSVKLLEAQGVEAQYACLSHRWSRPAVLETKRSNLTSHENGIDWDVLPKTFKDAILVAHDLGLRYLWIDSLCIVQDDMHDMWRELAKMSSIYANSHITIAATQSDGRSRGCYSEVSLYHQDHQLSVKQPDATTVETDLYVREKIAHIGEQGAVTPLLRRGWVCQERLLSPRVLQFCEKELVWECQESSSCQCSCYDPPIRFKEKYSNIFRQSELSEHNVDIIAANDVSISDTTYPISGTALPEKASSVEGLDSDGENSYQETEDNQANTTKAGTETIDIENVGIDKAVVTGPVPCSSVPADHSVSPQMRLSTQDYTFIRRHLAGFVLALKYVSTPDLNDEVILSWRHIIDDYSGMDLTKRSDRLPAIAGVASQFGGLLNSQYLAGLWQTALPADLLWRTDYALESGQHRSQYRAPTWSWASIDGKIKHYKIRSYHQEFSIISALCSPVTEINPFGEVTSGRLEVDVRTANLSFTLDLSADKTQSRRRLKVEFLGDSAIFIPDYDISAMAAAQYALTHDSRCVKYNFLCIGDFNIERNDAAVSEPWSGGSLVASLVIQEAYGGRYERVGILERTRGRYKKALHTEIRHFCVRGKEEPDNQEEERWWSRRQLTLI